MGTIKEDAVVEISVGKVLLTLSSGDAAAVKRPQNRLHPKLVNKGHPMRTRTTQTAKLKHRRRRWTSNGGVTLTVRRLLSGGIWLLLEICCPGTSRSCT